MPPPGMISRKDYTLLKDDQQDDQSDDGQEDKRKKKPSSNVWRLLGLAKEEIPVLAFATVMQLLSSVSTVAVPKLAGQLVDVSIKVDKSTDVPSAKHHLNYMLYEILGILVLGGVAGGLRGWLFSSAAERVMNRLRNRVFGHITRQEIGFFDRVRTGELVNRLSEDTRLMKSVSTSTLSSALNNTVVASFGIGLMLLTSAQLTGLVLACLPPLMGSFHIFSRINRGFIREGLSASAAASVVSEEVFGSIRTVRSFAKEGQACGRYSDAQGQCLQWGLKTALLEGFFFAFSGTLAYAAVMSVLWFGARKVLDGNMTPGDLSTFIIYAIFVGGNIGGLAGTIGQLVQALGASERVFELLDRKPAQSDAGTQTPHGTPAGGDIEFDNVWFSYPSRRDAQVLKGLSLRVRPGKRVALVGPSGQGKSTIVSLIQRFYDPQEGTVKLDGVPLPAIQHAWLHSQVSIVAQEPVLFADTLYNNIAYGTAGGLTAASQSQVEEAAKLANAHDFITSFPQGYQTSVGERGVRLSGGQRQRIAIARAILTRPRVLLLDEATSALDAESEALVQDALDRVAVHRTVLVIAHRLSTVQSADEVAVVSNGTIAERGSHADLLASGGQYAQLVRRQLLGGTSSNQGEARSQEGSQGSSPGGSQPQGGSQPPPPLRRMPSVSEEPSSLKPSRSQEEGPGQAPKRSRSGRMERRNSEPFIELSTPRGSLSRRSSDWGD